MGTEVVLPLSDHTPLTFLNMKMSSSHIIVSRDCVFLLNVYLILIGAQKVRNIYICAFLVAQLVKNPPATQEP